MDNIDPPDVDAPTPVPEWFRDLGPELSNALANTDPKSLYFLQAAIQVNTHPPRRNILEIVREVSPGREQDIIDETIRRSHAETNRQLIAQIAQIILAIGGMASGIGIFAFSDPFTFQKFLAGTMCMIVGVGGPAAAARLADRLSVKSNFNNDPAP